MKTEHIEKFIEDVQAGGFDLAEKYGDHPNLPKMIASNNDIVAELLLKPEAWKAVGKTRRWEDVDQNYSGDSPIWEEGWIYWMDYFIGEIQYGESINDALGAINNNN